MIKVCQEVRVERPERFCHQRANLMTPPAEGAAKAHGVRPKPADFEMFAGEKHPATFT
jgi:hypothetical protein